MDALVNATWMEELAYAELEYQGYTPQQLYDLKGQLEAELYGVDHRMWLYYASGAYLNEID